MRKLSNTNFYSLKDSEDIFLIHKENKNFIKYKEFVSDIVKSLEYISKFEEDTITVFIEDAYFASLSKSSSFTRRFLADPSDLTPSADSRRFLSAWRSACSPLPS